MNVNVIEKPAAYPMEMTPKDVAACQAYFLDNGLKQPFEQVWEPVIPQEDVNPDRYAGVPIPYFRFLNTEKHGIHVYDENNRSGIDMFFEDCDATVDRLEWKRHEISPNDPFEVQHFSFKAYTRQVNRIIAYLDTGEKEERETNVTNFVFDAEKPEALNGKTFVVTGKLKTFM